MGQHTDVIKIEGWWEETFWNDSAIPALINENFTDRDRDVAYATVLMICAKYPEVGVMLGVETRRVDAAGNRGGATWD